MKGYVFIDGKLVPSEEAKISVYDHGFLYGDGIFETMRSYDGKIFKIKRHLERINDTAKILEMKIPWTRVQMEEAIYQTIAKNNLLENGYIRLSITRGVGPIGIDPEVCELPTIIIMTKELKIDPQIYNCGIDAIVVKTLRNSIESTDPRLKTMNFLNNVIAKMEVKKVGATEGIMLNAKGDVAEATVSNIFVYQEGVLKTPSIETGILPGITREIVLELSTRITKTIECTLKPQDLFNAEEIFLTNSISEIIPVTSLNGKTIATGAPGALTKMIHQEYRSLVALSTK